MNVEDIKESMNVEELQEKESSLAHTVAKSFYDSEIDYSRMKLVERDITATEFQVRDDFNNKQMEKERAEKRGKSLFRRMKK